MPSSRWRPSPHRYGRSAETLAAWRLRMAGYRVVGRNVRVAGREVDIVARRGSLLVVCEVKARRSESYGRPIDALDRRKQERLRRAAEILAARDPAVRTIRFDVVVVEGWRSRHLRAVF